MKKDISTLLYEYGIEETVDDEPTVIMRFGELYNMRDYTIYINSGLFGLSENDNTDY